MLTTNVTNFRKNLFNLLDQTALYNEIININTKNGNVFLISEEDYKGLMETLYLSSIPNMEKTLIDGKNTPLEDCVAEDEVQW